MCVGGGGGGDKRFACSFFILFYFLEIMVYNAALFLLLGYLARSQYMTPYHARTQCATTCYQTLPPPPPLAVAVPAVWLLPALLHMEGANDKDTLELV